MKATTQAAMLKPNQAATAGQDPEHTEPRYGSPTVGGAGRFDSGKIPTPEMKALLSWMSGSRLIHFALHCKSSDFNKADRAEVMFFGMALLLQFEICESAADAIRIHGFGSLYEFFFQSGISRPWKLGTFYLEIFFAIVKTLFRGNHKEVSMLDFLAASRKANPYGYY